MTEIPADLRDVNRIAVQGRTTRRGWVYRGSVLVDQTWVAHIAAGPKTLSYPSLFKKPEVNQRGRKGPNGEQTTKLPLFMTIKFNMEDLTRPSEVIVRIVDPTFKFLINWKPKSYGPSSLASDPDNFTAVTKIIPYDPEWDSSQED